MLTSSASGEGARVRGGDELPMWGPDLSMLLLSSLSHLVSALPQTRQQLSAGAGGLKHGGQHHGGGVCAVAKSPVPCLLHCDRFIRQCGIRNRAFKHIFSVKDII